MRSFGLIGGIAVAALVVLMATQTPTGESELHAAVTTRVAAAQPTTEAMPTAFTVTAPTTSATEAMVVSGSEPDPESFDSAGLESWWSKYRKAHPVR